MADRSALAQQIAALGDELTGFFVGRGFSRDEATELSASTIANALAGLDRFRGASSPRTWVYRIARNLMANAFRGAQNAPVQVSLTDMVDEPAAEACREDPLHLLLVKETSRQVWAAIDGLTPRRRQILYLSVVEHHSHDEIAAILNLTPSTVRVTLHQTRNLLAQMTKN